MRHKRPDEPSSDTCSAEDHAEQDMVNSPPHYQHGGVETIDAIEALVVGYTGAQASSAGQIPRYLGRAPFKGKKLEDLRKARWYLDRLIGLVEKETELNSEPFSPNPEHPTERVKPRSGQDLQPLEYDSCFICARIYDLLKESKIERTFIVHTQSDMYEDGRWNNTVEVWVVRELDELRDGEKILWEGRSITTDTKYLYLRITTEMEEGELVWRFEPKWYSASKYEEPSVRSALQDLVNVFYDEIEGSPVYEELPEDEEPELDPEPELLTLDYDPKEDARARVYEILKNSGIDRKIYVSSQENKDESGRWFWAVGAWVTNELEELRDEPKPLWKGSPLRGETATVYVSIVAEKKDEGLVWFVDSHDFPHQEYESPDVRDKIRDLVNTLKTEIDGTEVLPT